MLLSPHVGPTEQISLFPIADIAKGNTLDVFAQASYRLGRMRSSVCQKTPQLSALGRVFPISILTIKVQFIY